MNFVKRLFSNVYILIGLFVLVIISSIIYLLIRDNKEYIFLTYPKEQCVLSKNDNPMFTVEIYSNYKNNEYLKKEVIDSIKIYDLDSNDFLNCQMSNIYRTEEIVNYESDKYYKYQLDLVLPINKDTEFSFNKAYLKVNYLTNENINFYIGNFHVYNFINDKAFVIQRMKGFVNQINKQDSLIGIYMELVNISNKKVVIEKIDYTSKNIITNYDYIREIENISENYQEKISNIVNEEYDVYRKSIKSNCKIEGYEEVIKLFIPLTYIKENSVSTTGIIIRYLIDDVEYQQIIEPFVFFNTIENTVEVEKIVFNPCKV